MRIEKQKTERPNPWGTQKGLAEDDPAILLANKLHESAQKGLGVTAIHQEVADEPVRHAA